MTELMVTVTSRDEATAAFAAGATIVDARAAGRLAALPRESVRAIAAVGGRVVATAGPDASLNDLIDLAEIGGDLVLRHARDVVQPARAGRFVLQCGFGAHAGCLADLSVGAS